MSSKLFFYDLETTGVKHWQNGIHQISGIVVIDGKEMERFNFKIQPNPACIIDEEALKIGGITKETLSTYMPMKEGYGQILGLLAKYVDKYNKQDKFHLIGYNNAGFDDKFLRAFFVQMNDSYFNSWFWGNSIDVMVLASYHLRKERTKLKDFKLSTVAAYFGVQVDENKLHDALYDVELTKEIYDTIEMF